MIIANIRKSSLVVSDFTENKNGVYYEAGYAKGLGIEVIHTCWVKDESDFKVHFDTSTINHILWKDSDDLYEKLTTRIMALGLEKSLPQRRTGA